MTAELLDTLMFMDGISGGAEMELSLSSDDDISSDFVNVFAEHIGGDEDNTSSEEQEIIQEIGLLSPNSDIIMKKRELTELKTGELIIPEKLEELEEPEILTYDEIKVKPDYVELDEFENVEKEFKRSKKKTKKKTKKKENPTSSQKIGKIKKEKSKKEKNKKGKGEETKNSGIVVMGNNKFDKINELISTNKNLIFVGQ